MALVFLVVLQYDCQPMSKIECNILRINVGHAFGEILRPDEDTIQIIDRAQHMAPMSCIRKIHNSGDNWVTTVLCCLMLSSTV